MLTLAFLIGVYPGGLIFHINENNEERKTLNEIDGYGYPLDDVKVFLKIYDLGKKDLLKSTSLRRDYERWRTGKLFSIYALRIRCGEGDKGIEKYLNKYNVGHDLAKNSGGLQLLLVQWKKASSIEDRSLKILRLPQHDTSEE
jgi:hypothetical protein